MIDYDDDGDDNVYEDDDDDDAGDDNDDEVDDDDDDDDRLWWWWFKDYRDHIYQNIEDRQKNGNFFRLHRAHTFPLFLHCLMYPNIIRIFNKWVK